MEDTKVCSQLLTAVASSQSITSVFLNFYEMFAPEELELLTEMFEKNYTIERFGYQRDWQILGNRNKRLRMEQRFKKVKTAHK